MQTKKIIRNFVLLSVFSITACTSTPSVDPEKPDSPEEPKITVDNVKDYYKVGDDYTNKRINNIQENPIEGIYDDFNSLNSNNWYVASKGWGLGNNGVRSDFVRLTDDPNGVVSLKGNGNFATEKDRNGNTLSRVGSALISKFKAKPGHYEIKMKVHPRTGACSAFWTYAYKGLENGDHINSEIDIELPGGSKSGSITFQKALNTNWIKETASDSIEYAIQDVDPNGETVAYNDGKWHTFGFDWYTDPSVIIYYADGKITNVSNVFVCDLEGRLWLGCWFPQALVGNALFETDYMFVDYVSYTPFKNQPFTEYEAGHELGSDKAFNTQPIALKDINKVSQGSFEFFKECDETGDDIVNYVSKTSGWELKKPLGHKEEPILNFSRIEKGIGTGNDDLYAAKISNKGIIRQNIDSVYDNYKFNFSFDAKTTTQGKAVATFFSGTSGTGKALKTEEVLINSKEFKNYTKTIQAPKGTQSLKLQFESEDQSEVIVDNIKLIQIVE